MNLPPRIAASALALALSTSGVLLACSSSSSDPAPLAAPASPASTSDAAAGSPTKPTPGADSGTASDAAPDASADACVDTTPSPFCKAFEDYVKACSFMPSLTCNGDCSFHHLCNAFDTQINSATRSAAQIACLTAANCDGAKLRDCAYQKYGDHPQTSAQAALVSAYCSTCAAADPMCTTTAIAYDADAGAFAVANIFTAAWEFTDAVTSKIKSQCTGGALDQTSAGTCDAAFGNCVAKVVTAEPASSVTCQ